MRIYKEKGQYIFDCEGAVMYDSQAKGAIVHIDCPGVILKNLTAHSSQQKNTGIRVAKGSDTDDVSVFNKIR
jgi:nitrous oxidase accessory protein NosD